MLRAAVYNRYWSTAGGAESYGGAVAELLSRRCRVELLAHEPVDLEALGERLALDLSGCTTRVVPQSSASVTAASAEVDLFVNVSHRSRDVSAAARSLYVVHFPVSFGAADPAAGVQWGTGVHTPEGATTWTDGCASLLVTAPRAVRVEVRLGLARPVAAGPTRVEARLGDRVLASLELDRSAWQRLRPPVLRFDVPGPAEVVLSSGSFVPADLVGGEDRRTLGVPVVDVRVDGRSVGTPPSSTAWLDGYDAVVANSAFTAGWVQRLWGRDSVVLHPPVGLREPGPKEQVILGVGRFFPRGLGHAKKQLELVQAFRRLVDGGLAGWELHLAGGCSADSRDYLEAVRAEAAGYPVVLHPNASGAELDALYARASVFWHAAGLGEDAEAHPERLEHFGIATVEAMSAGAVPVVLRAGGLVETVRDGVDGVHVDDLDGFVRATGALVADPLRLGRLSASAQQRARDFGKDAFDARLQQLLA